MPGRHVDAPRKKPLASDVAVALVSVDRYAVGHPGDRLVGTDASDLAPRKNKHPSPGTNRPDSHATTTCRG
jgi:hypothetical protein